MGAVCGGGNRARANETDFKTIYDAIYPGNKIESIETEKLPGENFQKPSSHVNIEWHEFLNDQVIFKYPLDWERCETEVGMMFEPPDAKLLGDQITGQMDRDLGLFIVMGQVQEKKPTGQMLDETIVFWETIEAPYPNFRILSVIDKKVKGANTSRFAQYSYHMGDCLFNGSYILAEKGPIIYTMQLFGTPERLNALGTIKDDILNSFEIC